MYEEFGRFKVEQLQKGDHIRFQAVEAEGVLAHRYEAVIDGFDRGQIEATILDCWGLENGKPIGVDSKPSPKGEKVLIEAAEVMSCDRLETA